MPHVLRWWGQPDPCEGYADPNVARWIVSTAGRAFAYLQDYPVHAWPNHHFADLPFGTRGIDLYIGPGDLVGRGHGVGLAHAAVARLFDDGAPVIATDPHPENARAIAVFRKAGFVASGPPRDSAWGPILPMVARR